MLQAYHTGSKEYYYEPISTTHISYTGLDHNYSLQTGYTTMKQIQESIRHVHFHQCNSYGWKTRLHHSRRNKDSNIRWWVTRHPGRTSTLWLAITKWGTEGTVSILVRDEIAIIDGTAMKRIIIVPASLQDKVLKQLHVNHMGLVKTAAM